MTGRNSRNSRGGAYRLSLSAMLLSLMLILGWVESMIPLNTGVPGIKLGLSNGVLIFAVYMLDVPTAYVLMAMKVILSGLMFSGVSAMMYGLCGGFVSLTCMVLLSRIRRLPIPAVGVAGGIMHNVGQVALSIIIAHLPVKTMLIYLAWLSAAGAVCGFLTGLCARIVMKHMKSAGMRQPEKQTSRNSSVIVAVLAVIAAAVLSWALYQRSAPVASPEHEPVIEDGGHALDLTQLMPPQN